MYNIINNQTAAEKCLQCTNNLQQYTTVGQLYLVCIFAALVNFAARNPNNVRRGDILTEHS